MRSTETRLSICLKYVYVKQSTILECGWSSAEVSVRVKVKVRVDAIQAAHVKLPGGLG